MKGDSGTSLVNVSGGRSGLGRWSRFCARCGEPSWREVIRRHDDDISSARAK